MIGLDISDRSVKVAQLSNDKRRKLLTSCWQEVPVGVVEHGVITNKKVLQQTVKNALKQCSIRSGTRDGIIASIPEADSFLQVIEIPEMAEAEIGEAVKWEVAQHIPFSIDDVYVDWQPVLGRKTKIDRREVLVGVAEKKVVEPLYEVLAALGLDVAAFELESQAIIRALISDELKDQEGLLIIDLGAVTTNVIIHDHGTIRFTATLPKGAEALLKAVPSVKPNQNPLDDSNKDGVLGLDLKNVTVQELSQQLQPSFDELLSEIHGIVEFYSGQGEGHIINEIIFTGGGSNLAGIEQSFLRFFENVHAERGNPWVNVIADRNQVRAPMDLSEAAHFATALGCALRAVTGGYERRN